MRNGSPRFYKLLEEMAETHDKKSHDYASNENPSGNYHFAGSLAKLFNDFCDAGFVGRIGEKIYRLANLENGGKQPTNESVEDTERDIAVITCLWMADRRDRRGKAGEHFAEQGIPLEYTKIGAASRPVNETQPAAPDYDSILLTMLALNDQILNYLKQR